MCRQCGRYSGTGGREIPEVQEVGREREVLRVCGKYKRCPKYDACCRMCVYSTRMDAQELPKQAENTHSKSIATCTHTFTDSHTLPCRHTHTHTHAHTHTLGRDAGVAHHSGRRRWGGCRRRVERRRRRRRRQ